MITPEDLETLERLYTPIGKILHEHLRSDHGYEDSRTEKIFVITEKGYAVVNDLLRDEIKELTSELASLKADYDRLLKINLKLERKNRKFILISEILE